MTATWEGGAARERPSLGEIRRCRAERPNTKGSPNSGSFWVARFGSSEKCNPRSGRRVVPCSTSLATEAARIDTKMATCSCAGKLNSACASQQLEYADSYASIRFEDVEASMWPSEPPTCLGVDSCRVETAEAVEERALTIFRLGWTNTSVRCTRALSYLSETPSFQPW